MPQQKEVAGVWYRNHEGKQFLKIALPSDAWGMTATVKTKKGIHKMTLNRWGDSTHKMAAYNHRHKPSFRDQRQIDRMEAETMVLYPVPMPNPVLPTTLAPGFAGRKMFPGGVRTLNWRVEGLRNPNPGFQDFPAAAQDPQSTTGYYRRLPTPGPYGRNRRRANRKNPSRRPHRRITYPSSPQYRPHSSSEDEAGPAQRRRGQITDPNPTPRPRDSDEDLAEDNQTFATPPEGVEGPLLTLQSHTTLSNELDKALENVLGPQGTDQAMGTGPAEDPNPAPVEAKDKEVVTETPLHPPREPVRPNSTLPLKGVSWSQIR